MLLINAFISLSHQDFGDDDDGTDVGILRVSYVANSLLSATSIGS